MPETLTTFLRSRQSWFRVGVTPAEGGSGWEVVLRIDGTYATKRIALEAAEYLRDEIDRLPA